MSSRSPNHFLQIGRWLLFLIACMVVAGYWTLTSPKAILMRPARGAQWIRRDQPFDLSPRINAVAFSVFSTDFTVASALSKADLRILAFRNVVVIIDGTTLFNSGVKNQSWKTEYLVPIPSASIARGTHHILLMVTNQDGPALVRADCPELAIQTGDNWQAGGDNQQSSPAVLADTPWEPALTAQFESTASDLFQLWPLLIILFITGSALSLYVLDRASLPDKRLQRWHVMGSAIRWLLLIGWVILACNNLPKLSKYVGYDAPSHFDYIQYIAQHHWIPLPNDGAEYFQTPLYYIVSAIFYKILSASGASQSNVQSLLRIVPVACGAVMVQICYLAGGYVFPRRYDLRAVATVIGGLIPMNLYMGQSLSNEPMAACACGMLILLSLRFICIPISRHVVQLLLIGTALGLAVLTKVSSLIWIIPLLLVLPMRLAKQPMRWHKIIGLLSLVPVSAIGMTLPYFLRNRLRTGQWIFFNAQLSGFNWSQDPGFRTLTNLLEFGHVFSHPAYSGFRSVWDSLYSTIWANGMCSGIIDYQYRPAWNYGLMSCGLWLAIFPVTLMIAGAVRCILFPGNTQDTANLGIRFLLIGLLSFIPSILFVFLTLPIYTCAKGSYLLGTIPCMAILVAAGFDPLTRHRMIRAAAFGGVFAWAINSYFTYFIF